MAKKGVLTSKELLDKQPGIKVAEAPASVTVFKRKGDSKITFRYKFPPAPLGQCQTTITYKGESKLLELLDGIYEFPEMKRIEAEEFGAFLKGIGFVDASIIEPAPVEAVSVPKPELIYKVGHPENTKDGHFVEGVVAVEVQGVSKQFECVKGVVTLETEAEYRAFIEKGWYEVSITPREET